LGSGWAGRGIIIDKKYFICLFHVSEYVDNFKAIFLNIFIGKLSLRGKAACVRCHETKCPLLSFFFSLLALLFSQKGLA
jgi:hypothetical protein